VTHGIFGARLIPAVPGPAQLTHQPISIRNAVQFAWPAFKNHWALFTQIFLTVFGAWVALEAVVISGQRFGLVLWTMAHLAFLCFFAGIEVGLLRICLHVSAGKVPAYRDAFSHLTLGPQFLAGQLLYGLMVLAGLAFLIVPGVLLAGRFAMFGFCMADGEPNLIRSFQRSANLSINRRLSLFAILVALFLFNLLGASVLGIGLFVTLPLSFLATTSIYRQLTSP